MSDADAEIDWSLTSWEGSRQAQLERALTLTVRERLLAAEGLADIARHFQEMRSQGRFAGSDGEAGTTVTNASEPPPAPSDQGDPAGSN